MSRFLVLGIALGLTLFLAGCATPEQRVMELQSKNRQLTQVLTQRETAIKVLKDDKDLLQRELAYYTKRADVLDKEKNYRLDSARELREGIRDFTDGVMQSLRSYYQKTEIVDYVGSEVYRRSEVPKEKNQVLIDMEHPMEADGTLIGASLYVTAPAKVAFCLLRDIKEKNQLQVVRMSEALSADKSGVQSWTFQVPLATRRGDYIGAYFPEAVPVPYDDVDTGNVAMVPGPVQMSTTLSRPEIPKRHRRAYSFGMVGFLNR